MEGMPGPSQPRKKFKNTESGIISEEKNVSDLLEQLWSDESSSDEEYLQQCSEDSSSDDGAGVAEETEGDIVWVDGSPLFPDIPFIGKPGLRIDIGNRPIDFFNLIFTDEFYEFIVRETNQNAEAVFLKGVSEQSRICGWKDLTVPEFKVFLGLLFHTGTIRMDRLQDYWKTHRLFNLSCFSSFMNRNRFLLVMRMLHLSDIVVEDSAPADRLHKIKPLINFFNGRMNEICHPSRELSIDEGMVLWKGRLVFKQYIRGKRHKYGVKLYMLAEATGFVHKIIVYTGSKDVEVGGKGHTSNVVMSLLDGNLFKGHSIYLDNFYNSVDLTLNLLSKKTYSTGTLRKNRKGNPKTVTGAKLAKGDIISQYIHGKGVCVSKWKDRREVLVISSEFPEEMVEIVSRRGGVISKPRAVLNYYMYMGGVDHNDQMMAYYPCERKTTRWYKKIAIHIFQQMLLNGYFLFCKYSGKKMHLYDYRLQIIDTLVDSDKPENIPKPVTKKRNHVPVKISQKTEGETKRRFRKRCQWCSKSKKVRKDTIYHCIQCPGSPGLCLYPCFLEFHK